MAGLKKPRYVAGNTREGIDLLYVGRKRLRYAGYPLPWRDLLIEPYCGIGRDFSDMLSVNLIVGAFGYNPETGELIKNVYGYAGVQIFGREPGFFDKHPQVLGKCMTEHLPTVGEHVFKARDDAHGYRLVEAWRALRILDAANVFTKQMLTSSIFLSGIGGSEYYKEGIGNCLSGLNVSELKQILESFPPTLVKAYRYILEHYAAYPSVSEMDRVIAEGYEDVKKLRQSVGIDLLDEENNQRLAGTRRKLNDLSGKLRGRATGSA